MGSQSSWSANSANRAWRTFVSCSTTSSSFNAQSDRKCAESLSMEARKSSGVTCARRLQKNQRLNLCSSASELTSQEAARNSCGWRGFVRGSIRWLLPSDQHDSEASFVSHHPSVSFCSIYKRIGLDHRRGSFQGQESVSEAASRPDLNRRKQREQRLEQRFLSLFSLFAPVERGTRRQCAGRVEQVLREVEIWLYSLPLWPRSARLSTGLRA